MRECSREGKLRMVMEVDAKTFGYHDSEEKDSAGPRIQA